MGSCASAEWIRTSGHPHYFCWELIITPPPFRSTCAAFENIRRLSSHPKRQETCNAAKVSGRLAQTLAILTRRILAASNPVRAYTPYFIPVLETPNRYLGWLEWFCTCARCGLYNLNLTVLRSSWKGFTRASVGVQRATDKRPHR